MDTTTFGVHVGHRVGHRRRLRVQPRQRISQTSNGLKADVNSLSNSPPRTTSFLSVTCVGAAHANALDADFALAVDVLLTSMSRSPPAFVAWLAGLGLLVWAVCGA